MRSFETISPFSWMTACGWFDYRRLQPLWHLTDAMLGWLAKEHLWWMKICLRNYYRCTVQCELCQLCSSIQVESSIQVALSVALGLVMHAWSMNLCLGTVLVVNPRDKNWLMRRHFYWLRDMCGSLGIDGKKSFTYLFDWLFSTALKITLLIQRRRRTFKYMIGKVWKMGTLQSKASEEGQVQICHRP